MSDFKCGVFSYMKDPDQNGGYSSLGDGNMVSNLCLEKDGVKMVLQDEEIKELLRNLKVINPTIYIR